MSFYTRIAEDSKQALIQLVSEAGHGKTSSLRTIIGKIKKSNPEIIFKIFDVSQAWYHCAPVKYRQLVTLDKVMRLQVANLEDCVYEIGSMSKDDKRAFVGMILRQDYNERYQAKLDGGLGEYSNICYVFEEANIYFGSYSFRKNDEYSPVFDSFVSVGRNYKMRGFLVATAEQGEMAPSLRRRTRKIYGRLLNKGDLTESKRVGATIDLTKIPKYTFHYYGESIRIPDDVTHTPEDYTHVPVMLELENKEPEWMTFIKYTGLTIFILWMLFSYFLG